MARELTSKEKSVAARFSRHGLEKIEASPISFTGRGAMFSVKDPVAYKVANSNAVLVFGEMRKSMGLDEIKEWLEREVRMNRKHAEDQGVTEIDGEDGEDEHRRGADGTAEAVAEGSDPKIREDDVKLIMDQVKMPREDVVRALRASDYDVVNTLVELTKNN